MGRVAKEVAGQVISFIGLVLAAVCCGVPMWRVTTYIGANIVTGQVIWDGLWMNCVMQSTGQMQCKLNESVMRLSQDLQAARAMVIICLIFGFIGFIVTFIGTKCTSCLTKDSSNATAVIIGGCLLILAAILILVPICWSAAISVSDFQSSLTLETQKREIGASIYIGWCSVVLLLIGGIILTTSCPPNRPYYPAYRPPIYAYGRPNTPMYGPVYAAPSNRAYSGTYTGSYVPAKPYAAPAAYSAQPYGRN
ncbi:claudin f [Poeciliopsis prolifica]|uniref:claudin f n=1 Tax=Poeciliopsis prolifica TaxID=188132 RepID=UPI0024132AF5|nr:claudin f [Poeciliopsis prolifica]